MSEDQKDQLLIDDFCALSDSDADEVAKLLKLALSEFARKYTADRKLQILIERSGYMQRWVRRLFVMTLKQEIRPFIPRSNGFETLIEEYPFGVMQNFAPAAIGASLADQIGITVYLPEPEEIFSVVVNSLLDKLNTLHPQPHMIPKVNK